MNRVLAVVNVVTFATALFARSIDPVVPQVAADLAVEPGRVALLQTAFALPFALVQPVLGPLSDVIGKTRLITASLFVIVATAVVCATASDYPTLFAARVVAGMAAGGIFPISLALIGDLVPLSHRQVALGRTLAFAISGNLMGSIAAGLIHDLVGWRGVFVVFGLCAVAATFAAMWGFRNVAAKTSIFSLSAMRNNYRGIFSNPRAKVCFTAVCLEGIAVFGLFPFVALLLHDHGEDRASIAGLVLGGFAVGGVAFSVMVGMLLARMGQGRLMVSGGLIAATGLTLAAFSPFWPLQLVALTLIGFGFYMVHNCIQVQASELSDTARGAAMSLHACFFFIGQAIGPVVYGLGIAQAGTVPTLLGAALLIAVVGFAAARLLGERPSAA